MSEYTTDAVELLLPYVWDKSALAEGTRFGAEEVQDPAMPKRQVDPSTGNRLLVAAIDVEKAFGSAPLTERERRAVEMRFKEYLSNNEIAEREGCSKSTMSARLNVAVEKITSQINRTP